MVGSAETPDGNSGARNPAGAQHRIDLPGGRMLGREAGQTLRRHGAVAVGPGGLVNLRQRGSRRFAELWHDIELQQCVMWFDNYVRPHSYVDPARGFHLFDCTAFAVMRVERLPPFPGMPHLADLFDCRRQFVEELVEYHDAFSRLLETVQGMTFRRQDVRVPLDVVRAVGRSPEWCPFAISDKCVSSQEGLVNALGWSVEVAVQSLAPMPVCVDENLHYRLLKLCYGENSQRYDVRSLLNRCPPLYGVWHAYKYVVTVVHRTYYAHCVYLLNGTVDVGRTFPAERRIRSIEMLLAVLLEARTLVKAGLTSAVVAAALADRNRSTVQTRGRLRNLMALKCLLDVYAPACFLLGWQARNCLWSHRQRGTGRKAKELLMGCLFVLLQLHPRDSHLVEYVRTLVCAMVCWTPWHSEVPGYCYSDESNEASLAQLGRWWAQHSEVTKQSALMDMYLLLPAMGRNAQDATVSRPSNLLRDAVVERLRALLRSGTELVTYVPWSSGRVCVAEGPWPADVWFPTDLSTAPRVSTLNDISRYALARLVQQQAVPHPVGRALVDIGLRERRDAQTLANDRVVGRLKADCPAAVRAPKAAAGVHRPQRRASQ